jgi:hypothetical protein
VTYRILKDRVKLMDSFLVPKREFVGELYKIRHANPECPLWARGYDSLRREWAAHNLAYSVGVRREKTKDCDLNYSQAWYVRLLYAVVGTFALWVIK